MSWGLTRFHHSGQSHFVTFCCYHRHRLFTADISRRIFESALKRVRRSYRLYVYGYVGMPEHVHLLFSEPQLESSPLKPKSGLSGATRGSSSAEIWEWISSRSFLHFETVSEGMDNDFRHVTFLVFLETVSHVARQNEEVRIRFGIKFLWFRAERRRLNVECAILHRYRYLAGVRVLIGPGVSGKYCRVNFRDRALDRLKIGPRVFLRHPSQQFLDEKFAAI